MQRLLLLAACAAGLSISRLPPAEAQSAATPSGGTLHIALRQDADILDPTLARSYVGRIVFGGLCDKLFDIDPHLQIVPQLATSYEWADPTDLVLHLRSGVLFQDGTKLDADAVKYSLMRHLTMKGSFRTSEINAMDHVDVVDPLTVKIVLKRPSSPFLAQLTDRAGMIVSPKAAEAEGRDFGLHPVCAGPFSFVERVAQDRIVLQRFPQYWNAGAIHFDRVIYQPIVDSSVRLANLQAGTIDLSEQILPSDADTVRKDPKLRLVVSDYLGYNGIDINVGKSDKSKNPLGESALVRKAFELSIDRAALIQVVYNGMYTPTAQAVPQSSPFYVPGVQPPPRDVAKAKALLKQAGVSLPVKLQLTTDNSPDGQQLAEVIQSMAGEAGFDVQIRVMEFATWLNASDAGDYQAGLLGWSGRVDADGNLWSFLHTGGANNDLGYSNPKVDSALDDARLVTDVARRRDLYAQMWAQETQDDPRIYLYIPKNIVGMSAKLTGFEAVPDGMIRLQGLQRAP